MSAQMKVQKKIKTKENKQKKQSAAALIKKKKLRAKKKQLWETDSDHFLAGGEKQRCIVRSVLPRAAEKKARGSCIWMTVAVLWTVALLIHITSQLYVLAKLPNLRLKKGFSL